MTLGAAVSTVSTDSALAGLEMVRKGGNAVDAGVAAALAAVVTHPAMCSLGGGGFITVATPRGETFTVDGGHEMPGRAAEPGALGRGDVRVSLDYAGGVDVVVGAGSVATPGLLAACDAAARHWGRLPWAELVAPSIRRAREGFPMAESPHEYLTFAHEPIYARDPRGKSALEGDDGTLKEPGEIIRIPELADTLDVLAREGVDFLYRGDLGRAVTRHVQELGGILSMEDLAAYRAEIREPYTGPLDDWTVHTVPAPAVGGASLVAMLALLGDHPRGEWTAREVRELARIQEVVLAHRHRHVDPAADPREAMERLLERARSGDEEGFRDSASTLHVSSVDTGGRAFSATFSDGYGSGIMPPGTGIWLNNCLGEQELNRRGFHALEPGTRLISNMTPTVALGPGGAVLALGSPGSARIPTAVLQVLLNHLRLGMTLDEAVAHPRLHVDPSGPVAHCEPGLPLEELEIPVDLRDGPAMFFGGVEAVSWDPERGFAAAADGRRTGGTAITG